MPVIPHIQEVAYNNIFIAISNVNFTMMNITFQEVYNYNPNDSTYSAINTKTICIPINSISATIEQELDGNGNEISSALLIKNGMHTILALNSNDWNLANNTLFTSTDFNNYYSQILDIATA